jgi:UTP:GlnB (protein PII) uridylyltransferase
LPKHDALEPDRCAKLLAALATPERLKIVRILAPGPRHVSDIAALLGLPAVNVSHHLKVLEVSGLDRPGLLYELTTALGKLNLNIASAHIATFGEKAVDVFYVTDLTGSKIINAARHATIRRQLLEVLAGRERPAADMAARPVRALAGR